MPLDLAFIEATLATLEENLSFLKELAGLSEEEFTADRKACYSAAYALMISIEALAGISSHLIAARSYTSPTSMANGFDILLQNGVLTDEKLVDSLKAMSRFRNLIVHRYCQVDYALVHSILTGHLSDFEQFAAEIVYFLDQN